MTVTKDLFIKVAPWLADSAALGLGGLTFADFDGWEKVPIGLAISLYISARAYQVKKKADSDNKFAAAERSKVEEEARKMRLENDHKSAEIEQLKAFTLDTLETTVLDILKQKTKPHE